LVDTQLKIILEINYLVSRRCTARSAALHSEITNKIHMIFSTLRFIILDYSYEKIKYLYLYKDYLSKFLAKRILFRN